MTSQNEILLVKSGRYAAGLADLKSKSEIQKKELEASRERFHEALKTLHLILKKILGLTSRNAKVNPLP